VTVVDLGWRALLAEYATPLDAARSYSAARERRDRYQALGVRDVVLGEQSIVVTLKGDASSHAAVRREIELWSTAPRVASTERVHEIPVHYDGEDMDAVCAATGLTSQDLIARHCAAPHTVAFCGFAPGWAYIAGLPDELHLPRRRTPRTRVPAGSVAIADKYSGIYPRVSPGGWHLIGRTDVKLWDPTREPCALLEPGDRVRFVVATAG